VPLDHYISQVHLKKFYSPRLGNRLHAIRKTDLKAFTPRSEDVCRIDEGSTNAYLREDRKIEEFLKSIEPKYSESVEKLESHRIDSECIYTIAGFVAYVVSCSPAGMRIHSGSLQGTVEMEATVLDSLGKLPPPPRELGGMNLSEILKRGIAKVDVDPKFPQAIGIASILGNTAMFGNFQWDVLRNEFEDSAYFTSDYPVAIETTNDPTVLNRVVPLSPSLAIRIRPERNISRERANFNFANFGCQFKTPGRLEITQLNKLIVRSAEELVLFRDNHPWVSGFVRKNRGFHVQLRTHKMPHGNGVMMFYTQEIAEDQGNH
jgi:hypothetical protein